MVSVPLRNIGTKTRTRTLIVRFWRPLFYQLNYPDVLEQVTGFGPVYPAWQASVIDRYTIPAFGTRTVDRTQDLLLVRQTLIPAELYGYVMRVHLRHLSVRFARVGIGGSDYLRKIEEKPAGGPHGNRTRHFMLARHATPHCVFWPIFSPYRVGYSKAQPNTQIASGRETGLFLSLR